MKRKSLFANFLDGFTSIYTGIFFFQGRTYISPVRSRAGRARDSLNIASDSQKVGGDLRAALRKARELKRY